MKKIKKIALFAAILLLTFSCTTDELVGGGDSGDVLINVSTDAAVSRSGVAVPDGYKLVCIMQLVNDKNAKLDAQQVVDMNAGSASFKVSGELIDKNNVKNALFWAEFQPTSGTSKVYDTEDLTKITYSKTFFDLSKPEDIAACEAFSGTCYIGNAKGSREPLSVKMTRSMSLMAFKPKNPEAATGATELTVGMELYSSMNVLDGKYDSSATASHQSITLTNTGFGSAGSDADWFTFYYLCPSNASVLDKAITMQLKGAGIKDYTYTIAENKVPVAANYKVNLSAQISDTATEDIDINVSIDSGWSGTTSSGSENEEPTPTPTPEDPDEPELPMSVGSYVNASGKVVADKSKAVGVVFHVGQFPLSPGDPDTGYELIGTYPTEYRDKTIKAYAVGLTPISDGELSFGNCVTGLYFGDSTNPIVNSRRIQGNFGASPFVQAYNTWVNNNNSNGDKVSEWYIPAEYQVWLWISMLTPIGTYETPAPTSFKEDYPLGVVFPSSVCYVSSTAGLNGVKCVNIVKSGNAYSVEINKSLSIFSENGKAAMCYPMMTIFE